MRNRKALNPIENGRNITPRIQKEIICKRFLFGGINVPLVEAMAVYGMVFQWL
jgi:hypothetical protein